MTAPVRTAPAANMPHLLRLAARVLSGSPYVLLGLDAVRAPGGRVDQAGPTLARLRTIAPLPDDDELIVRTNAAAQVPGGTLLALGKAQRLSAAPQEHGDARRAAVRGARPGIADPDCRGA
jgi:DoxX